ncbi:MAG: adenosylcobinamide-GDP ribazoletransferase [Thermoplasmataceae archaeon]
MIKSGFSFFTILPAHSVKEDGGAIYSLFIVNAVVGGLSAIIFYFLFPVSKILASVCAVVFLLAIRGFNDLDAVLDTGDALMARVDVERRRAILKDRFHGTGSIGTALVLYLVIIAAISSLGRATGAFAVLLGQLVSAGTVTLTCAFGSPFHQGLGSLFIQAARKKRMPLSAISLALPYSVSLILGTPYMVSLLISYVVWALSFRVMARLFSGINGDIIGFLGEASFAYFVFTCAILFFIFSKTGIPFSTGMIPVVSGGRGLW